MLSSLKHSTKFDENLWCYTNFNTWQFKAHQRSNHFLNDTDLIELVEKYNWEICNAQFNWQTFTE